MQKQNEEIDDVPVSARLHKKALDEMRETTMSSCRDDGAFEASSCSADEGI